MTGNLGKESIKVIAFDADDTLWSNEPLFRNAERMVAEAMSEFGDVEYISDELYKVEVKNMKDYGFGAMAYTLSMIENAVNLSSGKLSGELVTLILNSGRSLLHNPATPFPGVVETLDKLSEAGRYKLVLLTKGELLTQEHKIDRSGLGKYFSHIEIVSNKSQKEYLILCNKLGVRPEELLMVGNSFKSDIEPVLQLGGWGIHIPFEVLWKLEHTEEYDHPHLFKVTSFPEILPILL
ncbi:MAG: HAD family hydrolase [Bacteroidales bacterium]|nr:HAD family hydrolase [Bacteroidales bacterium]